MAPLTLPQRLDVGQAPSLWSQWRDLSQQQLQLDGGSVEQVDVAGLQLLLRLGAANSLQWLAVSEPLKNAASLAGVDTLLALP
ncbi:STAS domain-containing protein [Gallaecimonas kandeliae]|uniref:STAS domain-containing protein n=1 Tax=Gallaecimonas kandeliae TaxID=3029055 RepID=UPI0026494C88|nr:STAS domain-containing protein [Gallaecimonas kandeliae]WKE67053.1 STAS domain-containing protein [Gallaecimonas kandeliae]